MKKTVVIGASLNPARYANQAVSLLTEYGHEVVPIGVSEGAIEGIPVQHGFPDVADVHSVSVYLSVDKQPQYYDYIIGLNPQRIIFNPGAENSELADIAKAKNIETVEGCTLVMLKTKQF